MVKDSQALCSLDSHMVSAPRPKINWHKLMRRVRDDVWHHGFYVDFLSILLEVRKILHHDSLKNSRPITAIRKVSEHNLTYNEELLGRSSAS